MATTIHVGKKRVQTITTSDGSVLAPGSVTAASDTENVGVSVDADTNEVTLTGNAPVNGAMVTYSAAGYTSAGESITVLPLPTLIVVDGPEE